jgi:hypothetical protein
MGLPEISLALVIAFVVWLLFFRRSSTASSPSAPVGRLAGPGSFEIEVVGESHYQAALETICGGRTRDSAEKFVDATLVLEDSNAHDKNAVRVDINGQTVGYLPRRTAKSYRSRLRETGHSRLTGVCKAVIRGGWDRGPSKRGNFGVWLDLPPG